MTTMPDTPDAPTGPSRRPVFVLGMLQRTGTNYLADLFELHDDVRALKPIFEDHLVRWSPHLLAYVDDVTRGWTDDWEVPDHEPAALLRSLGDGVAAWVAGHHPDHTVVTKMPSVEQAEHFERIFPETHVVVLVRDGRNVVESGVNSFGWTYERAIRRWSAAAEIVVRMRDSFDPAYFHLVRYEDIASEPDREMLRLCKAIGLDESGYPLDAAASLPLRGSSTLRSEGSSDEIHWTPVEKPEGFDPMARWASWDDHVRRRFAQLAGPHQTALGYDVDEPEGPPSLRDRWIDWRDGLDYELRANRVRLGRARRAVRRVHGRV